MVEREEPRKRTEQQKANKGKKVGITLGALGLVTAVAVAVPLSVRSCVPNESSFTVKLEMEGVDSNDLTISEGSTIKDVKEQLKAPEGYEFDGFYRDPDFESEYDDTDPVTKDSTIYVKTREIVYNIIFEYEENGETKRVEVPVCHNDMIDPELVPEVSDKVIDSGVYKFSGWRIGESTTQKFSAEQIKSIRGSDIENLVDGHRELHLKADFSNFIAKMLQVKIVDGSDSDSSIAVTFGGQRVESGRELAYGSKIKIEYFVQEKHNYNLSLKGLESVEGEDGYYLVTGDENGEVEIAFSVSIKQVTVTFTSGQSDRETVTVDYGTAASTSIEPSKSADKKYRYSFSKWVDSETEEDVDLQHVTRDMTVKPKFTETWIEYEILGIPSGVTITRFRDIDGFGGRVMTDDDTLHYEDVLKIEYVESEGHKKKEFKVVGAEEYGEEGEYKVTGDLTVTFLEEYITYTVGEIDSVKIYRGSSADESQLLKRGDILTWGESITIEYVLEEGYEFSSLVVNGQSYTERDKSITIVVKGELDIKFERDLKHFTVEFYSEDGSEKLDSVTVEWSESAEYSKELPSKASDERNSYSFLEWVDMNGESVDLTNVKKNMRVKAKFSATPIEYSITITGTEATALTVYNQTQSAPVTSGGSVHYEDVLLVTYSGRIGYNQSLSVTGAEGSATESGSTFTVNAAVTITLTEQAQEFSLGTIPEGVTVQRGSDKLSNNATIYYDEILNITYSLSEHKVLKNFKVSGAELQSEGNYKVTSAVTIEFAEDWEAFTLTIPEEIGGKVSVSRAGQPLSNGAEIKYNDQLTISYTESEGHHKTSFTINSTEQQSKSVSHTVTGAVTVGYTEAINTYSVKYYDEDGSKLLHTETVEWGKDAKYSTEPSKAQDDEFTYAFDNWYTAKEGGTVANLKGIKAETNVYARYSSSRREYTITIPESHFKVEKDGSALSSGDTIYYNDSLTITVTASTGYDFRSFKINGTKYEQASVTFVAKGNVTISDYAETIKKFTVKFYDEDGVSELHTETVEWGKGSTYSTKPTKQSTETYDYTFSKWVTEKGGDSEADLTDIREDTSVYASYTEKYHEYTLTFDSELTVKKQGSDDALVSGKSTLHYGDTIVVTFQSKNGYTQSISVSGVSGEGTESGSTFTVTGDVKITYSEEQLEYRLSFNDDEVDVYKDGSELLTPDSTLHYGDSFTIRYTQKPGYTQSISVTGASGEGTESGSTFTVTGEVKITYSEEQIEYSITITGTEATALTVYNQTQSAPVTSGGNVHYGDVLLVSYNGRTGYNQSLSVTGAEGSATESGSTFTVTGTVSITLTEQAQEFSLGTIPEGVTVKRGGSVLSADAPIYYDEILNITYSLSEHKVLKNFKVSGAELQSENNYKVTGAVTIEFAEDWEAFTLTIPEDLSGRVSVTRAGQPLSNGAEIKYNDQLTISYTESEGHHKTSFTINGAEQQESSVTITVTGAVSVGYSEELIEYQVEYFNEDGSQSIYKETVKWGQSAQYSGTPSKAEDNTYTYTFAGWASSKNGVDEADRSEIKSNRQFYAHFNSIYKEYSVSITSNNLQGLTVYNDTQSVAVTADSTVHYGDRLTISYNTEEKYNVDFSVTGASQSGAQYVVEGDLSVTYNRTIKTFTITFYDETGANPQTEVVEWGNGITHANPSKAQDNTYTYTFAGWYSSTEPDAEQVDLSSVKQDRSVYARFNSEYIKYYINFESANVSVFKGEERIQSGDYVHYNEEVTISYELSRGHKLVKFQLNGSDVDSGHKFNVTQRQNTIDFEQTLITYTFAEAEDIKIYRGAEVNEGKLLKNGDTLTWGEQITIVYVLEEGYEFDSLTVNGQSYTAQDTAIVIVVEQELEIDFSQKLKEFTVTYYSEDGSSVLSTEKVKWDQAAKYAETPSKAQDNTFTYRFASWVDKSSGAPVDLNNVRGNIEVKATFTATYIEYSLSFNADYLTVTKDGKALKATDTLHFGDEITIESHGDWIITDMNLSGATALDGNKYSVTGSVNAEPTAAEHKYLKLDLVDGAYQVSGIKDGSNPTAIVIPDNHFDSKPITSIAANAFSGVGEIQGLTIGKNITNIGSSAFAGCTGFDAVNFTGSIDQWASINFEGELSNPLLCMTNGDIDSVRDEFISGKILGLPLKINNVEQEHIKINVNVNSLAFAGCSSLKSVTFGDNCTSIGSEAFMLCQNLSSFTINSNINSLGSMLLMFCSNLKEINYTGSIDQWASINFDINNSVLMDAKFSENGDDPTYVGRSLRIKGVLQEDVTINVNVINGAFAGCSSITNVKFGDNCTDIGAMAFQYCANLTSVTVGKNVADIGNYAFYECTYLTIVVNKSDLPIVAGEDSYGYVAFYASEILNGELETIDGIIYCSHDGEYEAIGLQDRTRSTYTLLEKTTKIGANLFANCTNLTSITIPKNVTDIGERAFYDCINLTEIIWNAVSVADFMVDDAPTNVFYNAGAAGDGITLTFGDSVKRIPAFCFVGVKENPSNYYDAYRCAKLKYVTISSSVTSVGLGALMYCTGLKEINYTGSIDQWASINFGESGEGTLLLSIEFNEKISNIVYFGRALKINNVVQENITINVPVNAGAFMGCSSLKSVTLSDSVTRVAPYAFTNCSNLKEINYTGTIDQWASIDFNGTGLFSDEIIDEETGEELLKYRTFKINNVIQEHITINVSVNAGAFAGCSSLKSVTLSGNCTNLGERAFFDCENLTSIIVGSNVASIDNNVFWACSKLNIVYYKGNRDEWDALNKNIGLTNNEFTRATRYYFSANNPYDEGTAEPDLEYWHYGESGEPEVYEKQYQITFPEGVTVKRNGQIVNSGGYLKIGDQITVTFAEKPGYTQSLSVTGAEGGGTTSGSVFTVTGAVKITLNETLINYTLGAIPEGVTVKKVGGGDLQQGSVLHVGDEIQIIISGANIDDNWQKQAVVSGASLNGTGNYSVSGNVEITVSVEHKYLLFNETAEGEAAISTTASPVVSEPTKPAPDTPQKQGAVHSIVKGLKEGVDVDEVVIPSTHYDGTAITEVAAEAFKGNASISQVTIGENVKEIGAGAFENCAALNNVIIGYRVQAIRQNAFCGCSNLSVAQFATAPSSVTISTVSADDGVSVIAGNSNGIMPMADDNYVGEFPPSGTTEIVDNNSLTTIEDNAFAGTILRNVVITSNVSSIGENAFAISMDKPSVTASDEADEPVVSGGVTIDDILVVTIHSNEVCKQITSIDSCGGLIKNAGVVNIPYTTAKNSSYFTGTHSEFTETHDGISYVFYAKSKSYTVYNNVVYNSGKTVAYGLVDPTESSLSLYSGTRLIADHAFENCTNLTSVTLNSGLLGIGANAFANCSNLTTVTIPETVTDIGAHAFANCSSLTTLNFNAKNCKDFDKDANPFLNTGALDLVLGDGVTNIPAYMFYNSNSDIRGVYATGASKLKTIGTYAFYGCSRMLYVWLGTFNGELVPRPVGEKGISLAQSGNSAIVANINGNPAIMPIAHAKCFGSAGPKYTIGDYAFANLSGLSQMKIFVSDKLPEHTFENINTNADIYAYINDDLYSDVIDYNTDLANLFEIADTLYIHGCENHYVLKSFVEQKGYTLKNESVEFTFGSNSDNYWEYTKP